MDPNQDPNPPDLTEGQEALLRPQLEVPPFEALAKVLPREAFTALQTVLTDLDQRLRVVESRVTQQLQTSLYSAISNAYFTVNVTACAHPSQIPALDSPPPEITLSSFSGKANENIHVWISIMEDSLCATQVPRENWSCYAAFMLRDTAALWYYAKKMANNGQTLPWDVLRQAMIDHWDPPGHIDELCLRLYCITFRGSIPGYVRLFQGVEIQIPTDAMSFDHRKQIFLRNLPAKLAMQLDQQGQSDMGSVYLAARRWETFFKVARTEAHLPNSFKN
jgi:hypothetical protein